MKLVRFLSVLSLGSLVCFVGCSSDKVDVVDLNKVLDAVASVLEEGGAGADATATAAAGDAQQGAKIKAVDPSKIDGEKEKALLTKLADKMNEVKVMDAKVGVSMTPGGELIGFQDPNGNNTQEFDETKEFTVTIDLENNRLVASDNNGYHRPYGFRPGGLMAGYFLGSMLGRQNSFYGNNGVRPNFSGTQMSPQNYHSSAVSSVKSARASSARMTTGSKGFSFGK
jgi:hypothetical protein